MDQETTEQLRAVDAELPRDELFNGGFPIADALAKLRLRLLDLTARNRLLNFKATSGKAIQFVDGNLVAVYNKILESTDRNISLLPVPEPKKSEFVEEQGRRKRPDVRDHARAVGISTSYEITNKSGVELDGLRVLQYPDDLERQCRKIASAAKTALEETGANMLFLLIGFLEFPESPGATKSLLAPLVALPVALEKGALDKATGAYRYAIRYTGEELTENLSLREKLTQDFNLTLPEFTEESTLGSYFKEITRVIARKEGFKLRHQATLALVSMTKMLLVRDLNPSNWPSNEGKSLLIDHSIVRAVFEGQEYGENWVDDADEYVVDSHKYANLPLIADADSSQHSALADAIAGKNLVIEGPPGTGKSQTITNLIASAIANGKKVLFVAEKLAALQVVKSRLTQAGLGDFCLELHSNKASKKELLDSIETRARTRYARPPQIDSVLDALQERRKQLTEYVELLNSSAGSAQGLTIHQILWRAERYRQQIGESWRVGQVLKVDRADALTKAEFDSLYDQLDRLVREHERIGFFNEKAPYWGFFVSSLAPGAEVEIERALDNASVAIEALCDAHTRLEIFLKASEIFLTRQQAEEAVHSISELKYFATLEIAGDILPRLFRESTVQDASASAMLESMSRQLERAKDLNSAFCGKVLDNLVVNKTMLAESNQILGILKNLGLAALTPMALECVGEQCKMIAAEGLEAIDQYKAIAEIIGHNFQATDRCLQIAELPVTAAIACPRHLLHLRTPALASPHATSTIGEAKRHFALLAQNYKELEGRLYLDVTIDVGTVERAVQALRQGDEWWRLFQVSYRRAVSLHKSISRNKKVPVAIRRNELEELHRYYREFGIAVESKRYAEVMGEHWKGAETDFDSLEAMASWLERTRKSFLDAGLEDSRFSPLTASISLLGELTNTSEAFARAKTVLERCKQFVLTGPLAGATAMVTGFQRVTGWDERLRLIDAVGSRLTAHAQTFSRWGVTSAACEDIATALEALHEYQEIKLSVEQNQELRNLLGTHYRGIETNLQPILSARDYGITVLKLGFPAAVNRMLLGENGQKCLEELVEKLNCIQNAWGPIDSFCDFMHRFGRFDLLAWAGAESSSPEFIKGFRERTTEARARTDGLIHWVQYIHAKEFAIQRGLNEFVELLEKEKVARSHIPALFGYRFYGTIAEMLFSRHKVLGKFSGLSHEAVRQEFQKLDKSLITLRGKDVAATSAKMASPPAGTGGARVADKTQRVLLQYLFPQPRPRIPIRKLMQQAGAAIQAYKPCFMMGPQAVAQFLEPGALDFDIVVMDEASQLKPEEALGSIARGKQLVVVGDPKQLPPTTFFDKLGETEDEDDPKTQTAVLQPSILEVCMGHFRPIRTLRWHYRSQHHSLIAFSNARFYKNNLIVFPSPFDRSRNLGCKMMYVPGATYDSQMNTKEAQCVVDAIINHMREHPEDSLGVVTLNLKQRDLIDELLDKRARALEHVDSYKIAHEKRGYGFFVKNLENVQGDERDVIFISTTFGPAPGTNAVFQRFGPISQRDGWRRLNVLFTRARKALTVFTSMRPEDIVDGENVPRGRKELRAYLEFLRTGHVPQTGGQNGPPDSDFEIAVLYALEQNGYECTPQLGVAGYRIDLAVKHPRYPGSYFAAIECDGASYHSGRSARDRDRIRQEILEQLGWRGKIYRIWSTDWYRSPTNEIGRLVTWLKQQESLPMDEAYIVDGTSEVERNAVQDSVQPDLDWSNEEVTLDQDAELEVEVGDKVTISNLSTDTVEIVDIGTFTDESRGVLDYKSPKADALLGLQVGEIAIVQIANRPVIRLRVLKIERHRMPLNT